MGVFNKIIKYMYHVLFYNYNIIQGYLIMMDENVRRIQKGKGILSYSRA